jgi:hypothetical protein
MEITLSELMDAIRTDQPPTNSPYAKYIGKAVFIRTVTHHHTGRVVAISGDVITLADAAWVADDGRFADMLKTGKPSEVEPFVDNVDVNMAAAIDVTLWGHPLPKEQQ